MIRLEGLFSESFGGTCTIRGYAKYDEIVGLSYPHPGYQRPIDDVHVDEISKFITSGSNSFSPEVVLAYTAKYDYYKEGAVSGVDAMANIRSGIGFTSNIDGFSFAVVTEDQEAMVYLTKRENGHCVHEVASQEWLDNYMKTRMAPIEE